MANLTIGSDIHMQQASYEELNMQGESVDTILRQQQQQQEK